MMPLSAGGGGGAPIDMYAKKPGLLIVTFRG